MNQRLSNRNKWLAYQRFVDTLEQYGTSGVMWRALAVNAEIYDWWQTGLLTTYECVLLFWHVGLAD
jgi:hypothetical protein